MGAIFVKRTLRAVWEQLQEEWSLEPERAGQKWADWEHVHAHDMRPCVLLHEVTEMLPAASMALPVQRASEMKTEDFFFHLGLTRGEHGKANPRKLAIKVGHTFRAVGKDSGSHRRKHLVRLSGKNSEV